MYRNINFVTDFFFQSDFQKLTVKKCLPLNVFFGWDFPGSSYHWGGVGDFNLDDFASDLTQHVALVVVSHVVVQEVLGEDDP